MKKRILLVLVLISSTQLYPLTVIDGYGGGWGRGGGWVSSGRGWRGNGWDGGWGRGGGWGNGRGWRGNGWSRGGWSNGRGWRGGGRGRSRRGGWGGVFI